MVLLLGNGTDNKTATTQARHIEVENEARLTYPVAAKNANDSCSCVSNCGITID
jgi:hypothetical protein